MRVLNTDHQAAEFATSGSVERGTVIFGPDELRPWIEATIARVVRKVYGRLPWLVRRFVSEARLVELILWVLREETLPASPGVQTPSQHP